MPQKPTKKKKKSSSTSITREFTAELIADGRVTVPAKIRRLLGLKPGDYLVLQVKQVDKGMRKLVTS